VKIRPRQRQSDTRRYTATRDAALDARAWNTDAR